MSGYPEYMNNCWRRGSRVADRMILDGTPYNTRRDLVYSEEKMDLKMFWEEYKDKLPVFLIVMEGFMGYQEFDIISSGELYWVSRSSTQTRVVAKDYRGDRYISIPLDYQVDVVKVNSDLERVGEPYRLEEFLDKHELPVNVKVATGSKFDFYTSADISHLCSFQELKLIQTYEERYLLANPLLDEEIGWTDANVLPLYLPIAVSLITKAERVDEDAWQRFHERLLEQSKACNYDYHPVNKDIMVFSAQDVDRSEGIYDYIEPQQFLKLKKLSTTRSKPRRPPPEPGQSPTPKEPGQNPKTLQASKSPVKPKISPHDNSKRPLPPIPKEEAEKKKQSHKVPKEEAEKKKQSHKAAGANKKVPPSDGGNGGYVTFETPASDPKPFEGDIKCINDIPNDVSSLSVTQVGQCLKLLHLNELVPKFKANQINGALLAALDPKDLQDEFGISGVTAKKVCLFGKGEWRPEK